MNLTDIRKKAEDLGIDLVSMKKLKKADLIRAIQSAEGNTACYASRSGGCPYVLCCFMTDCYSDAANGGAEPGNGRAAKSGSGKAKRSK